MAKKDEEIVRSWIDVIKSWGVNERGQPSDGGFGFGRFSLLTEGRDSLYVFFALVCFLSPPTLPFPSF